MRERFDDPSVHFIGQSRSIDPDDLSAFFVRLLPVFRCKLGEGLRHTRVKLIAGPLDTVVRSARGRSHETLCGRDVDHEIEIGPASAGSELVRSAYVGFIETAPANLVRIRRQEESVHQYNYPGIERRVNVPRHYLGSRRHEKQRFSRRRHVSWRIEEDRPYRVAKRCAAGLAEGENAAPLLLEQAGEQAQLRRLSGALGTLENNESSGGHAEFQLRVIMELVAPFFIPSMIQLFTWYMTLSKFS